MGPVIKAEYLFFKAPKDASNKTSNIYFAFLTSGRPSFTDETSGTCFTFIEF